MRILFIDDDKDSVGTVMDEIRGSHPEYALEITSFGEFEKKVNIFLPNLIILDLFQGSVADDDVPGEGVYEHIWEHRMCPLIVYSAHPERLSDEVDEHPIVKYVKKGGSSLGDFLSAMEELSSHVYLFSEAELHLQSQFSVVFKDLMPYVMDEIPEDDRSEMLVRSARRRIAALMDSLSYGDSNLTGWEQYIHPPISKDLKLGDILRKSADYSAEPGDYMLVLTPSCDMVSSGGRTPKVNKVLVAECQSISDGFNTTSKPGIGKNKLERDLQGSILTRGYFENLILVPCLPGKIPTMVANLTQLRFIDLEDLRRGVIFPVASTDHPFCGVVSWAYLQNACRPGLPDRDVEKWSQEILEAYQQ